MKVVGFEPRLSEYPGCVQWKTFTDTMRWLVFSPLPRSEISKLMPVRYLYLLVFFYRNPFMKGIVWSIAHLVEDGPEPALTTILIFYCWATDWGWVLFFPWVKLLCIHTWVTRLGCTKERVPCLRILLMLPFSCQLAQPFSFSSSPVHFQQTMGGVETLGTGTLSVFMGKWQLRILFGEGKFGLTFCRFWLLVVAQDNPLACTNRNKCWRNLDFIGRWRFSEYQSHLSVGFQLAFGCSGSWQISHLCLTAPSSLT